MIQAGLLLALVLVDDPGGALQREILHQRAPEGHVDDLEPPADSQDGPARAERLLEQCEVDGVPLRVDLHVRIGPGVGPIASGVHVDAAAQQERVEGAVLAVERRHDPDRGSRDSGGDERPDVVVGLRIGVAVESQGDARW